MSFRPWNVGAKILIRGQQSVETFGRRTTRKRNCKHASSGHRILRKADEKGPGSRGQGGNIREDFNRCFFFSSQNLCKARGVSRWTCRVVMLGIHLLKRPSGPAGQTFPLRKQSHLLRCSGSQSWLGPVP